ncbi:flavin-dependent L-tryptophan oxidase RebO (plasmid) [Scytonema sp. HK-05]|nr:flavin-dependent L-tryptophan oxidase RebO [Scytonema sp. HK-05]
MEGSPRIGGRVWTHRFGNSKDAPYAELRAMRIPSDHEMTLHYVHEMGLSDKLCKFMTVFEESNAMMNINGQVLKMKDAPGVLQQTEGGIFSDTRYSERTRAFAAWLKTIINTIAPGNLRSDFERDLNSHLIDISEKYQYRSLPVFQQAIATSNRSPVSTGKLVLRQLLLVIRQK